MSTLKVTNVLAPGTGPLVDKNATAKMRNLCLIILAFRFRFIPRPNGRIPTVSRANATDVLTLRKITGKKKATFVKMREPSVGLRSADRVGGTATNQPKRTQLARLRIISIASLRPDFDP